MNILGWAVMVAIGANAATRFVLKTQDSLFKVSFGCRETLKSIKVTIPRDSSDCYFLFIKKVLTWCEWLTPNFKCILPKKKKKLQVQTIFFQLGLPMNHQPLSTRTGSWIGSLSPIVNTHLTVTHAELKTQNINPLKPNLRAKWKGRMIWWV